MTGEVSGVFEPDGPDGHSFPPMSTSTWCGGVIVLVVNAQSSSGGSAIWEFTFRCSPCKVVIPIFLPFGGVLL